MKIGIVGLGLIGGSLGLKLQSLNHTIYGIANNEFNEKKAKDKKLANFVSCDLSLLKKCELIILALPIKDLISPSQQLVASIPQETILTDVDWISEVTTPNGSLVIMDGTGRYAKCTVNGDDIIIPGDWTTTPTSFENSINGYILGYLYDYQVDLPTLYVSTTKGEVTRTDVNASLTLHRLNFNFGKIGSYATTLTRLGKDPYTEIYESTDTNLYEASDAPYLEEAIKTIPVYERNKNVDITLKSTSPTPATLHSMSWEGDYSTKYYKRV